MLHTRVEDSVVEHLEGGLVVDIERGRLGNVPAEFSKEMLEPLDFCPCVCRCIKLCLGGRLGNWTLKLG